MGPAKAGECRQLRIVTQCLGGDADVGFAIEQHLRNLLRRPLPQVQRAACGKRPRKSCTAIGIA